MNFKNTLLTLGSTMAIAAIPATVFSCAQDDFVLKSFDWDHFYTDNFLLDENLEINDSDNGKFFDMPGLFASSVLSDDNKEEKYKDIIYELADNIQGSFSDSDNNKNNWVNNFRDDSEIEFNFSFNFGDAVHLEVSASTTLDYIINNISSWTSAPTDFIQVVELVPETFSAELIIPETSSIDRSVLATEDRTFVNNLDEVETELIRSSTKRLMTMLIDNAFMYLVDINNLRKWDLRDQGAYSASELTTALFSENQVRNYWVENITIESGVEGRMKSHPFPVSFWNKTGFDGSTESYDAYAITNETDQVEEVYGIYNYLLFSMFNMDGGKEISYSEAALVMTETDEQNTLVIDEENTLEDFAWGYYKYGDRDEEGNKPEVPNRPYFAFESKYNIHAQSAKEMLLTIDSHFTQIEFTGSVLEFVEENDQVDINTTYLFNHLNYDDTTKTLSQEIKGKYSFDIYGGILPLDGKMEGALEPYTYSGQLISKYTYDDLVAAIADPAAIIPIEELVNTLNLNAVESDEFVKSINKIMINNTSNWYKDGEEYGDTNKLFEIIGVEIDTGVNGEIWVKDDIVGLTFLFKHVILNEDNTEYRVELRLE